MIRPFEYNVRKPTLQKILELEHAFRFNDAVLRHLTIKRQEAVTDQSPMMKAKEEKDRSGRGDDRRRPRPPAEESATEKPAAAAPAEEAAEDSPENVEATAPAAEAADESASKEGA